MSGLALQFLKFDCPFYDIICPKLCPDQSVRPYTFRHPCYSEKCSYKGHSLLKIQLHSNSQSLLKFRVYLDNQNSQNLVLLKFLEVVSSSLCWTPAIARDLFSLKRRRATYALLLLRIRDRRYIFSRYEVS